VSDTTSKPAEKPVLLVVDDEEGPRASLKVVFKNDFDVLLAANGREGIEIARQRHIDVAILDILMHGMSGVDVLRELKIIDEGIEVIMLTAYETLETARQALRFGAREYLNKPFDIPTLRAVAARALEKRRATSELRSAHQRLAELQSELHRSVSVGETAKNIVHDLNNPLTVISGFVELLHRQVQSVATLEGDELERMRGSLARVQNQVQRCLEISRRYLGSRRANSPSEERSSVNDVLQDLQELLLKHPSAANQEFVVHVPATPLFAAMNGTDLLRVLLNLATNALQASAGPHRVEVGAEAVSPDLDLASFADNDSERFIAHARFSKDRPLVAITVRDTGPGMPPALLSRLFNESFSTKPAGQGHGIGLGSVKELVFAAEGAARVTTAVGKGSAFTVYLPSKP
jgi:two-component system, sensor histidine kinase and response regulator